MARIKEYDVGARNIHHNPSLKTATTDLPGETTEIRSTGDAGPVGDVYGNRSFKMGPQTKFDYSKETPDLEPEVGFVGVAVQTNIDVDFSSIVEEGIKLGLTPQEINSLVEVFSKGKE